MASATAADRERWAAEAADAVDAAAADVRRRMNKALSKKKLPARARGVFRSSWWDQAMSRHVAPVFDRIADEAATSAVKYGDSGDAAHHALNMLAERTGTVRARVRELHAQAVREGWDGARLAEALGAKGGAGPMSSAISRSIGESLATSVVQGASHHALADAGATATKTWHCAFLPTSRAEHRSAHGQEVKLDDPFKVAGVKAMYPGDPALPVSQTAGCRCWVTYDVADVRPREAPDHNGNPAPTGDAAADVLAAERAALTKGQAAAVKAHRGKKFQDIQDASTIGADSAVASAKEAGEVWAPTMTAAQAEKFAEASKFKQTFYHGTASGDSAEGIKAVGFDDAKLGQGSGNRGWAGEGAYFTELPDYASTYAMSSDTGRVLAVKVKANNPWEATLGKPDADDFYAYAAEVKGSQDDISAAIRAEAERRGHDSIVMYGKNGQINELVLFRKDQVVVTHDMTAFEAYSHGK